MSGHPARQDEAVNKLFKTMRAAVELVQTLEPRISAEGHLNLRAAALGLMSAYSEVTGLPSPTQILERTP